jgi:hypothetical protein
MKIITAQSTARRTQQPIKSFQNESHQYITLHLRLVEEVYKSVLPNPTNKTRSENITSVNNQDRITVWQINPPQAVTPQSNTFTVLAQQKQTAMAP